jgi:hypothetical protein
MKATTTTITKSTGRSDVRKEGTYQTLPKKDSTAAQYSSSVTTSDGKPIRLDFLFCKAILSKEQFLVC